MNKRKIYKIHSTLSPPLSLIKLPRIQLESTLSLKLRPSHTQGPARVFVTIKTRSRVNYQPLPSVETATFTTGMFMRDIKRVPLPAVPFSFLPFSYFSP